MPILTRIIAVAIFTLALSACHTIPASSVNTQTMIAMTADDDQDGVLNEVDACPTTALNVVVDERGCPAPLTTTDNEPSPEFRLFFPKNQNYPFDDYK